MKEILSGLIGPVIGIINKVVPDKDESAQLAHEFSTMTDRHAQALAVVQIEVNRARGPLRIGFKQRGGHCAALTSVLNNTILGVMA